MIFNSILEKNPPSAARLNPELPIRLEEIIAKAMEKHRDVRFQHAADIRSDLKRLKRDTTSGTTARGAAQVTQPATPWWQKKAVLLVTAAAVFVLALGVTMARFASRSQTIGSLAVLPFTGSSSDSNAEFLKDGITEGITDTLSQLPNLRVMASSSVLRYKGNASDPQKAGRDLKVDAILTGRIAQRGDNILVSAELVNVADASQIWGHQYSEKLADIPALQQEVVRDVSEKLRLKLTGLEKQRLATRPTENAEAYQLYMRGRYEMDRFTDVSLKRAAEFFQQAIDKDPVYAAAYAGMAGAYAQLGYEGDLPPKEAFHRARAAADRALALDDNLAEAHQSLAVVHWFSWEFAAAEQAIQRALQLNPNLAAAHDFHGAMLCSFGRCDEGAQEAKRSQELDPLSLFAINVTGDILAWGRKYDESIAQYQRALEIDPNYPAAHNSLTWVYVYKRDYDHAMNEREQYLTLVGSAQRAAEEKQIFAASGYKAVLRRRIEMDSNPADKNSYYPANVAYWYAELGDKEKAFFWLEKAYDERSGLNFLQVDPDFDNLRSDPRYTDLVRRMGFPQ